MKKIFLVVQDKDAVSSLQELRDLGLVHVEHVHAPQDEQVSSLKEDVRMLDRVVEYLSHEHMLPQERFEKGWKEEAEVILGLAVLIDQYSEGMAKRQVQIEQWERWGDFSLDDIDALQARGLQFELVEIPAQELDAVPLGIIVHPVFEEHKLVRAVAIAPEGMDIPFKTIAMPPVNLNRLKEEQKKSARNIREAKSYLLEHNKYLAHFKEVLCEVRDEFVFHEVLAGKGREGDLVYIKGFCPADSVEQMNRTAMQEHWALLVQEPDEEDDVPTLLRNPKWVEIINPVFQMINILPGYKELDISMMFLMFFSIFFGILIGDAGYGLVFALSTAFAHVRFSKTMTDKTPVFLMYILSACTILWGVLTGTFFGQQWLANGPIQPLVPWLSDGLNVQKLTFFIGALHLSIAHVWRAVRKMPSWTVLAEIGWLSLIWGMFFMARKLVLGEPFVASAKILFMIGPVLVVFFTKPNINPLKAIGGGIGDLLLNVVNTFTDVVSYIRLFAVGLATVAVADAFNTMALGLGFNSVAAGLGAAVILVVGHLFNIILGAMSILVHGLRLNVLEFSGHLNLEWAGFRYNPFKKIKEETL